MTRQKLWRYLLVIAILFGSVWVVSARALLQNRDCTIASDEVIDGTLFVFCENLHIQGTVNGNIIGVGLHTIVDGTVNGSAYLAGLELAVKGHIAQSLHYVGITLELSATDATDTIVGNVLAGTLKTTLYKGASVGGSVLTLSYEWNIDGVVRGEINFWGSRLSISGTTERNVYASVGDPASDSSQIRSLLLPFGIDVTLNDPGMVITKTGKINGSLDYTGLREGTLEGRVIGASSYKHTTTAVPTFSEPATLVVYGRQVLSEFSSLLVIGLLGSLLAPNIWQRPIVNLRFRPLPSFSAGLLAFILSFPILFIVILLSLIVVLILVALSLEAVAVAVGFGLVIVNGAGAGAFYFVAIYLARVVVGWALGRFLLGSVRGDMSARAFAVASLALGLFCLAIAVALPSIGWVINALTLFFGLGTILLVVAQDLQRVRDTTPTTPPSAPYHPSALRVNMPIFPIVTPTLERPVPTLPKASSQAPLGMDNLPDGFNPDKFFRE